MRSNLFVFGRTPEFAASELSALFPTIQILPVGAALLEHDEAIDIDILMDRLGGTVKIAEIKDTISSLDPQILMTYLPKNADHFIFGISLLGKSRTRIIPIVTKMKKILERKGVSARYIIPKDSLQLSSVVIEKQHVYELFIVKEGDQYIIAHTIAVQPFEQWNRRDYGRPYADPHAGMLPPKVARMAVNIALGNNPNRKILLDPFCGMGTILAEARLVGASVIGNDQSERVVTKTQANLTWLELVYSNIKAVHYALHVGDAVHISGKIVSLSIDAIVTEPFLGSTEIGEKKVNDQKIRNIIRGLEKLYIGCFKDWHKVLKPGGKLMIALPSIATGGRHISVKKVIDTCENLGYTKLLGPIEYGRPQAIVKREFYLFKKIDIVSKK